ncbi:hypothetical protein BH24CHL10_BH24CHL10_02370 [soil metagenome]
MGHEHDHEHDKEHEESHDTKSVEARADEAQKSSGGLTGGEKSLSADGTTSGGIGSGANAGTGGDVGNWDEGGSGTDAGAATEDEKITYPAGTSASAIGDWSARQSGSGRESDPENADEGDDSAR